MQLDKERIATGTPEGQAGVLVVRKHHLLVRCSRLHPELDAIFVSKADRTIEPLPSVPELKKHWTEVNGSLFQRDRSVAINSRSFGDAMEFEPAK